MVSDRSREMKEWSRREHDFAELAADGREKAHLDPLEVVTDLPVRLSAILLCDLVQERVQGAILVRREMLEVGGANRERARGFEVVEMTALTTGPACLIEVFSSRPLDFVVLRTPRLVSFEVFLQRCLETNTMSTRTSPKA